MVTKKKDHEFRTYARADCVTFRKTSEPFGGLSNMASGFPLRVNGRDIRSSEALYQACRFPHRPDVQELIIREVSPMTAKMRSKPYRGDSRPDWEDIKVNVMRWCLRVKLAQNWSKFGSLLLETGERPIVEDSRKDDFWGAKATADGTLVGTNALGRLLMELREKLNGPEHAELARVRPPRIPNFLLFGERIGDLEGVVAPLTTRQVSSGESPRQRSLLPDDVRAPGGQVPPDQRQAPTPPSEVVAGGQGGSAGVNGVNEPRSPDVRIGVSTIVHALHALHAAANAYRQHDPEVVRSYAALSYEGRQELKALLSRLGHDLEDLRRLLGTDGSASGSDS